MCSTTVLKQLETRLDALISNQKLILRANLGYVVGIWKVVSVREEENNPEDYTDWGDDHQFKLSMIELNGKTVNIESTDGNMKTFTLAAGLNRFVSLVLAETESDAHSMIYRTKLLIKIHESGDLRELRITHERRYSKSSQKLFTLCSNQIYEFTRR